MSTYHCSDQEQQKLDIPSEWLSKLQSDFQTSRVTDEELCETIRTMQAVHGIVIDPHTAVAVKGAQSMGYPIIGEEDNDDSRTKKPFAILATASPCKFQEAVTMALGTGGWDVYMSSGEYPDLAREYLAKAEKEPILYAREDSTSLEEAQHMWESQTRQLLLR